MVTNFEIHECIILVQSTKIGTHEFKAIHSSFRTEFRHVTVILIG